MSRAPHRLIGLHGRARTGKDTISDYLRRHHDFARLSFAQPIKDALMVAFRLRPADFDGDAKEIPVEGIGRSPRFLMQTLGTEWGRDIVGADTWVRIAEQRLEKHLIFKGTVITDVRFENETAWIRSRGGEVWHIERRAAARVRVHSSEAGIAFHERDKLIENDGTVEQLHELVNVALRTVFHHRV